MMFPSRHGFESSPPQPLVLSFPQAGLDPFDLYRRLTGTGGPTFLLETGRPAFGRPSYSFFGERPYATLSSRASQVSWSEKGRTTVSTGDPLATLWERTVIPGMRHRKDVPPFVGGTVGFLSYDLARTFESVSSLAADDLGLPELHFAHYDLVGAVDHEQRHVMLLFTPPAERYEGESRARLYEEGRARLTELHARLIRAEAPAADEYDWRALAPIPGQTRQDYIARIAQCQDYIRAGDIYQANLSHRFSFDLSALGRDRSFHHHAVGAALYERLRRVNPSPFSALMSFDDVTLVSCSPERLVRLLERTVETRPIAGTRPRGAGPWEDDRLKHELLANAKERAEHLMLVDLERNDLGRVCVYGSVVVDEFMSVEQYSHVSHLVSNVRGTLRPDVTGADVVRAVFPGGTITGVPKVRCMQVIDELEPVRRGIYTGSLGYLSRTGDMDLNILIRTMALTDHEGYLQVGAGIVADSDPSREYEETLHKGQAFFSALHTP